MKSKKTYPTMRERQKEMTFREIKAAGKKLFYAKGFDAVQIDEIAKIVGISRGTFYLHFSSKVELLVSVCFDALDGQYDCYKLLVAIKKIDVKSIRIWLDEFRGSFDERRGVMTLFPVVFHGDDQEGHEVVLQHRDRIIETLGERFKAFRFTHRTKKQAEKQRVLAYLLLFQIEQIAYTFSVAKNSPDVDVGFDILAERIMDFISAE